MKRLVLGMTIAGTTILSLVGVFLAACSSAPPVGGGGSSSAGGAAGGGSGFSLKLDASTSGPGAGGHAGSAGLPTGDANCGSQTSSTTKQPPDVLLVLDRSASMQYSIAQDCYCTTPTATGGTAGPGGPGAAGGQLCADTTNCTTRWQAIQPAVTDTVTKATDVSWGLKFFPTPNAAQCSVSAAPEVPIQQGNAAAVQSQVQSADFSLSTPTAAAIKAAADYLKGVSDDHPKFILLATDGEPNCGGKPASINTTDVPGAASAAAAAYAAGFPVYVVGIGPNLANLTQLAQSGGTKDYYPVSSPQQLTDAFASISKLVASCTFTLSATPQDANNVAVYLDKNLVPKDDANGWSFGANSKSIELHGTTCAKVTSGDATTVQVLFGCASPPQFIP